MGRGDKLQGVLPIGVAWFVVGGSLRALVKWSFGWGLIAVIPKQ